MDIKLTKSKKSKQALFKEFEFIDLIPYSLALIMIVGQIYFLFEFINYIINKVD